MSLRRLRVGIAGKRGRAAIPGLLSAGAEVHAVGEPDPVWRTRMGEAAQVPESRRFDAFETMLDAGLDAVVVATPMHLHAPQALTALQAGVHVLSEVTGAVSLAECAALFRHAQAAGRRGCVYMMGENNCYIRQNVLVRELARAGAFGEPYFGEGEYLHDCKRMHHDANGHPTWRAQWQVGRNGSTYGTHSLGPVMQWLETTGPDPIRTVSCLGCGRHTDPVHAIDDTVIMLCQLASGRLARVRLDMMSNHPAVVAVRQHRDHAVQFR